MNSSFKSFLLRLKLLIIPVVGSIQRVLNVVNGILAIVVVAIVIYELGFQVTLERSIIRPIYRIAFGVMYFDFLVNILIQLMNWKPSKRFTFEAIVLGLLTIFLVLWLLPHRFVQHHHWITLINNFKVLTIIVIIQSIIKLSFLITHSLKGNLNANAIFVVSFLLLIFVGSGLLMLPRSSHGGVSFIDALFISTSSVCVTGLSTVDITSVFTQFGQIIILILIQLGGIGIMTFTSFLGLIFVSQHSTQNKLAIKDILDPDKGLNQIFGTLRNILITTFLIEIIGAYFLYLALDIEGWDGIWQALFHSISAFCNAGFSTLPNGMCNHLVQHNYWFINIISWLIIIGGVGFPIIFNFLTWLKVAFLNRIRKITGHAKDYKHIPHILSSNFIIVISITAILLVGGTVVFMITEYNHILAHQPWYGKLTTAFFMSTTPRTAGFNTFDMMGMRPISSLWMILLMWIGASPMSTGGGIKTTTFGIAILNIYNTLRGRDKIEVSRRQLSSSTVNRAFIIIFVSVMLIIFGTILIYTFDPYFELRRILFEVVSALSTVGLSLNLTPLLSTSSHIVLIVLMFVGRVGLITVLASFIKEKNMKFYSYPSEHISIN